MSASARDKAVAAYLQEVHGVHPRSPRFAILAASERVAALALRAQELRVAAEGRHV